MINITSTNGTITISRGDSFESPLFINMGTLLNPTRYEIGTHLNAKIYLGVMEPNQPFECALIRQMYQGGDLYNQDGSINTSKYTTEGDLLIKISPEDTYNLRVGKYYYQVILVDDCEDFKGQVTIIDKTPFYII